MRPARYLDPIDLIWLATARRLGLVVRRRPDVFASVDGHGVLYLGTRETLDPDDCTAQMVLHELCHWMVNGRQARHEIDWGFEPMEGLDWREFPTLRLQRALVAPHGLEALLAPTTQARSYWDRLTDPLLPLDPGPSEGRIVERTRLALERAAGEPWQGPVQAALRATAQIRGLAAPHAHGTTWG